MSADGGTNGAKGPEAGVVVTAGGVPPQAAGAAPGAAQAPGPVGPGSQLPPPVKVIEIYPAPEGELPPPSFRQALIGYGSIILGLVLLGVLLGVLMRILR